jgi:hypothetical protein
MRMKFSVGVLALILAATLACGDGDERTIQTGEGSTATVHEDDEGVTVKGTTEDGEEYEVRVGAKADLPDDFPDDVPVHPEASVEGSMSMPGKGQMITFQTDSTPDEVYRFYKSGLVDEGWSIEADMNVGGQHMMAAEKGDRVVSLQMMPGDEGGTRVVVTVGQDD